VDANHTVYVAFLTGATDACAVTSVSPTPWNWFTPQVWQEWPNKAKAATLNGHIWVAADGVHWKDISSAQVPGGPPVSAYKTMVAPHPSGTYLFVGVEEPVHGTTGWWDTIMLESGEWLNMWVTTLDGSKWWQITNYNNGANPQGANGYTGPAISPDGQTLVWAETVSTQYASVPGKLNWFGVWKLRQATLSFVMGTPVVSNTHDITPPGANWLEPGNFSPNGYDVLLTADIGIADPQGQDQFKLNINTGQVTNLTNSPQAWDEHGLFSPDGKKIAWMSSKPFPNNWQVLGLRTEFFLMNADGTNMQQLTHFNTPGYPEYQVAGATAAIGWWSADGTTINASIIPNIPYQIHFAGPCGKQ
jgi:hypothetical protein